MAVWLVPWLPGWRPGRLVGALATRFPELLLPQDTQMSLPSCLALGLAQAGGLAPLSPALAIKLRASTVLANTTSEPHLQLFCHIFEYSWACPPFFSSSHFIKL